MKKLFTKVMILCVFFALFLAVSCSGRMGYSVMLWSIPEYGIADGDIVPVYIRSNIGKVYGIGVPNTDEKIEVPLWQITEPESARKVEKTAEKYADYRYKYASVKRDGLVLRAQAVNTAKDVYRLRSDEIIKILFKGEGQPVMVGANALEGDWLWVMTTDGTVGWCFSYNLTVFDEREGIQAQVVDGEGETDEVLEGVLAYNWYPEYYRSMIYQNRIDIDRIQPEYGFDPGLESGQVTFISTTASMSYPYSGITKIGRNEYTFDDTPIRMTVRGPELIVVQYTNEAGFPVSYNLVTLPDVEVDEELDADGNVVASVEAEVDAEPITKRNKTAYIQNILQDEKNRRLDEYHTILDFGSAFSSSNYGSLNFTSDGTFTWRGYDLLVDSKIILTTTGGEAFSSGTVATDYFIENALSNDFDGVLTFLFDTNPDEVNFLYKIEGTGLRLENINNYDIEASVVMRQSNNPLVMFFAKVQ